MVCGRWQKPRGFGNMVLTCVSVSADSTGTHSLYTTYQDYEIMFHVSTLLPYTPNNRQQVSRVQLIISTPEPQGTLSPQLLAGCLPGTGGSGVVLCSIWRPLALDPCTTVPSPGWVVI